MIEDQIGRTAATEVTYRGRPASVEPAVRGDTVLVCLRGPVDAALTRSLRDALSWVTSHHRMVLVDLSAVSAVDVSGLSALVLAHRRAVGLGASRRLVRPSPPFLEALLRLPVTPVF